MQFIRLAQISALLGLAFWCALPAFADKPIKCRTSEECLRKGQNLIDGRGTKFDPDLGILHLEAACAMDNGSACFAAGVAYERFLHVENRKEKGLVANERACKLNIIEGCNNAVVYLSERAESDPDIHLRAHSIYTAMCDADIGLGCQNLAVSYYHGTGVEKNEAIANELLLKACDLDSCPFGSAPSFVPGEIRPLAQRRADELERRCISSGNDNACRGVINAYNSGNGVKHDPDRAIDILATACSEHANPCWHLGQALMYGRDLEKDLTKGLTFLKLACNGDIAFACADVVRVLNEAPELADNSSEARAYLQRACDLGDSYSCENLEDLETPGSE